METKEKKNKGIKALCMLKGSKKCPKPKQCDGINRQCLIWLNHSGR